jgi:hypothetical protein
MLAQVIGLGMGIIGQFLLLNEEREIIWVSKSGKTDASNEFIKYQRKLGILFTLLAFVLQFIALFLN